MDRSDISGYDGVFNGGDGDDEFGV